MPERDSALAAAAAVEADVAGVDLLVGADGEIVVPEVNGIPGWQALQSVCDQDLTARSWSARARRWSQRDAALVQGGRDQRPGGAGRSSARRSASSRTPPPA